MIETHGFVYDFNKHKISTHVYMYNETLVEIWLTIFGIIQIHNFAFVCTYYAMHLVTSSYSLSYILYITSVQ